jgi:hypothetical protein
MFFTEWGSATPRLERALLDGSERRTLVNTKIVYPYGVAVDLPNRFLFTIVKDKSFII